MSDPVDPKKQRPQLPSITRPNGKEYRPRKLSAHAVNDLDEELSGVVVFGTHDPERAQSLADSSVAWWSGENAARARKPSRVWWRERFNYGRLEYVDDYEQGRAGIYFAKIEDS